MAKTKYLTAPLPITTMPPGIPYIVGNEAAERFSFYGMRGILSIFMTDYLVNSSGALDVMTKEDADFWYHVFMYFVYGFPLLGGLIADLWLGKYNTIIWLSIVYCLGHVTLAIDDTRLGLAMGLGLIALGSGGIKPCVSAHVGDQFGAHNKHLVEKVYSWFYFSINIGAALSSWITPRLLSWKGPHWAFLLPGILMGLATIVFWMGRYKFAHIPPAGMSLLRDIRRSDLKIVGRLISIYAFIVVFFALYDQTGSEWVQQAKHMDLHFDANLFGKALSYDMLPSETQVINPVLVLIFIPLFTYALYPAVSRYFPLTPLRKVGIGLFLTSGAFCISALIQHWIDTNQTPHILWQFLAYAVITAAEVMVSITGLEFSYTQAPPKMKSFVMSLWLMAVALGNLSVSLINWALRGEDDKLRVSYVEYYQGFALLMAVAGVIYIAVALRYKVQTQLQPESNAGTTLPSGGSEPPAST